VREDQARDSLDVVEMRMWQTGGKSVSRIGGNRGDGRVVGVKPRLPVCFAMDLELCVRIALIAFDKDKIDGTHQPQKLGKARLFGPAEFVHEGEPAR
jgi:hypothetical protein